MAETFSRSTLPCDTGVSESNYSPRSDNEVDKDTPLNPPTLSTYLSGCLLFIQWRRQWKHELACCPARLAIRLGSATFALVCTWFEWLRASNSKQFPHMSNTSLMRRARTREKRRNSHTRYRPKYSNSGGNSRQFGPQKGNSGIRRSAEIREMWQFTPPAVCLYKTKQCGGVEKNAPRFERTRERIGFIILPLTLDSRILPLASLLVVYPAPHLS